METDSVELMQCRNCKSFIAGNGKFFCKERLDHEFVDLTTTGERVTRKVYQTTKEDDTCSMFDENLDNRNNMQGLYFDIINTLKEFVDTKQENYEIIALWIIGTWLHDNFLTYPYLFFNAMKGSGKTRLLKLIKELSYNGDMLASLSEAVLFRTTGTLCIDEFESIGNKDKNALRELLNTAYKKGGKVKRIKTKKSIFGEERVVEEFSTFRPIVMANINGMEEVSNDRCIAIILEKSNNYTITRKVENFEFDENIQKIKEKLIKIGIWCSLCSVVTIKNIYIEWNRYITTLNYTTTLTTPNYTKLHLFEEIAKTDIDGRNLELGFPLFMIAEECGILDKAIGIFKEIVAEKRDTDVMEGKDVMVIDFISKQLPNEEYKINDLTNAFKIYINYETEDEYKNWLNSKWLGRSLKRLNLILSKRRLGSGVEVILNIDKATEKMRMFKK